MERLEIHHLASPEGDLHFALLSDWTDADAESVGRRRGAGRLRAGGHRWPQRTLRPRAGGPPVLPAASSARLERNRNALDRLGAQTRQASRVEPAASRRHGHHILASSAERRALPQNVRYVVTLDSDTRLPREAVRRLIGKMAHPLNRPRLDAGARRDRGGLRRPAAAGDAVAPQWRRRFAVSARLLERQRHRSLLLRRLRRLSGHVRRGLLRGQGHLRYRRLRGGARGPRAGLDAC